jgi:hypothetical protein
MAWWQTWRALDALPFPGSMIEQPAYVFEALHAAEIEAQQCEAKRQRKADEELRKWQTQPARK